MIVVPQLLYNALVLVLYIMWLPVPVDKAGGGLLELGSGEKAPIALRAWRSTSAFFGCVSMAIRQT